MEIEVTARGRNEGYDAYGVYDGKGLIVKAGSRIAPKVSAKIQPIVIKLRNDSNVVSRNYIVQKDVRFRSASTAASFVAGTIQNGKIKWRDTAGKTLWALEHRNGE